MGAEFSRCDNVPSCIHGEEEEIKLTRGASALAHGGVSVLVCSPDVNGPGTSAARAILDLAHRCDAKSVHSLFGARATAPAVRRRIRQLGARCRAGDTLVLYFASMNAGTDDVRGVFLSDGSWLSDADVCRAVKSSAPSGIEILIVSDRGCENSTGAFCTSPSWIGMPAAALCGGQRQHEPSTGLGHDMAFTEALLRAVEKLSKESKPFSLQTLLPEVLQEGGVPDCSSPNVHVAITFPRRAPAKAGMLWPLLPKRALFSRECKASCSNQPSRPMAAQRGWSDANPHVDQPILPVRALNEPTIHLIACYLDYENTSYPLTCSVDGKNVSHLARQCNVQDIVTLRDNQATVENVKRTIQQVGSRCSQGDYFIFFYAGHGTNVPDIDGDEEDGQDEAYCFVNRRGQVSTETFLKDDDFARIVTSSVPKHTNVLIISDCCHSATIADFNRPEWYGYRAVSMSGCTDWQTSGDTGNGGIFTHSLLLAVERLGRQRRGYSVGLFREVLKLDRQIFCSSQDITIQAAPGMSYDSLVWPLVPRTHYQAPFRAAKRRELPDVVPGEVPAMVAAVPLPVLLSSPSAGLARETKGVKGDRHEPAVSAESPEAVMAKGSCGCMGLRKARRGK
eukprot:TRINITY_DN17691_c0_g1_i3.p1 TRINITY_DN17691_c0_g1~~TRINITY_DN17691_c0_g1_i3.p1  ORF type:complete len:621 (+),score=49.58 TRINITY_DN17691_c0_g1_i3:62-1924(+)